MGLLVRTQPEVIEDYRAELWKLLDQKALRPRVRVVDIDVAITAIATRRNLGRMAIAV